MTLFAHVIFFSFLFLSFQLLDTEQRNVQLESDVSTLSKLTAEAGGFLDSAQNDLQNLSDELAQLYHHVCTVNGETPSRVILDHEKSEIVPEKEEEEENGKMDWGRTLFKTDIQIKDLESLGKAKEIAKQIETAVDQIKHLKGAVEHMIELSTVKKMQSLNVCNVCEGEYTFCFALSEKRVYIVFILCITHGL